jgi:uncharacterized RDD family membrane protein YckC
MSTPPPSGYAGFVTRAVGLTVDALLLNAIAIVIGAAVTLIASVLGADSSINAVEAVIGGFAWLLWSAGYFVTFWTLTGQTPGDRLMGVRVVPAAGGPFKPMRAFRRFIGLLISAIPLGAGFLPVLVDDKRRGLHDRIGGTVVVWALTTRDPVAELVPSAALTAAQSALPPVTSLGTDDPVDGLTDIGTTQLG